MARDERRYSRVYHEAVDDPKFREVWEDDSSLALWVRLLVMADMAWPTSATLPRSTKRRSLARLVDCGLVDLGLGDRYRIHGLDLERSQRSTSASQNAQLRWNRPKIEGGRPASRRTRFKVLERDQYRCRYCGRSSDEVAIDVDHITPVREGGTDELDNLVAACVDCNMGKSGHPLMRAYVNGDARASKQRAREVLEEEETSKKKGEQVASPLEGRPLRAVVDPT